MKIPTIADAGSIALIKRLFRDNGAGLTKSYILIMVLGIGIAATAAVHVWIIKDVINEVFLERRADMLFLLSGVIVVNGLVRGFTLYFSTLTIGRVGNAVVARAQRRMFDHLLNLGVDFYSRTPSSDLVTRISHNAAAARDVLTTVFTSTARDLLTLIALITVMIVQSPLMSLIILVIGPITISGIVALVKRARIVARAQFASLSAVISGMQQTAHGIRVIKAFNMEAAIRERMAASIDQVRLRSDKIVRLRARSSPLMEVFGGLAIGGVVLFAGYQTIYLDMQPGAFLSFLAAMALAFEPARRLGYMQIPLEAGLVGVRLMFELLDTKPTMELNADGPDLSVSSGEIVFEHIHFGYAGETPVFRGLDFTAAGGKTTALVGPSGSGKSTMISLIERFYNLEGGRILIDGQDIATVKLSSLHDQIALVSQSTVLFTDTVRQNIRFGRPDATDAEVEQAARAAMAHDFIMAMENGYETVLSDESAPLSGGQRQRIAIARAILRDAAIILLDEATSSLDSESEHQIQLGLEHLIRGRTTIVIAHRLSTVLGADKIAVLVDGRIVEEGCHDTLLALGKHYARFYRLQFERRDVDRPRGGRTPESVALPAE
ncbi:MAG: ABC transporter ATP-binding protein [Bauldia sp.]